MYYLLDIFLLKIYRLTHLKAIFRNHFRWNLLFFTYTIDYVHSCVFVFCAKKRSKFRLKSGVRFAEFFSVDLSIMNGTSNLFQLKCPNLGLIYVNDCWSRYCHLFQMSQLILFSHKCLFVLFWRHTSIKGGLFASLKM